MRVPIGWEAFLVIFQKRKHILNVPIGKEDPDRTSLQKEPSVPPTGSCGGTARFFVFRNSRSNPDQLPSVFGFLNRQVWTRLKRENQRELPKGWRTDERRRKHSMKMRNRKQEKKWTKPRKMGRSNPRDGTTDLFRQCLAHTNGQSFLKNLLHNYFINFFESKIYLGAVPLIHF